MAAFPQRLVGKRIAIFVDYTFEDVEVMFPKYRLEEDGSGSQPRN